MSNQICAGRCGSAVVRGTICKTCCKLCHPGCLAKHDCVFAVSTASTDGTMDPLHIMIKDIRENMEIMVQEQRRLGQEQSRQAGDLNQLACLMKEVQQLREQNEAMRKLVITLNEKVAKLENNKENLANEIHDELNERKYRESNVIVFKLEETSPNNKSDDLQRLCTTFKEIDESITIKRAVRFGRRTTNNPRPVKVMLSSVEDARKILKNRKKN